MEQAAAAAWALPRRPIHAELPDRPLGRRVDSEPGAGASWGACDREPARFDRAPGESVVCDSGWEAERRSRRSLVWRAGMERLVAHHRRAGPAGRGARDGRLQSLRFWLRAASPARSWRRRSFMAGTRPTAWAGLRGCCTVLNWSIFCRGREATARQASAQARPVIYNSWEATEFNVNEAGQMALAEKAAALGIDRFVMDDGWFGQRKGRPRRPGRLVCESRRSFPTDSSRSSKGSCAGNGFRVVG